MSLLGRREIAFTLRLGNENFPQVKVELYRKDGTYCLAVVDGKPLGLIERSLAVDLVEAVNEMVL